MHEFGLVLKECTCTCVGMMSGHIQVFKMMSKTPGHAEEVLKSNNRAEGKRKRAVTPESATWLQTSVSSSQTTHCGMRAIDKHILVLLKS